MGAPTKPLSRPIRVLVAKPGLDGHDRGAKIVARALRDAGFEVIYTGLHQTPEQVVATAKRVALALQEALRPDGLNLLQANGAAAFQSVPHFHLHLIPRWTNDGKGFDWKLVPGDRDRIAKASEQIRAALGGGK